MFGSLKHFAVVVSMRLPCRPGKWKMYQIDWDARRHKEHAQTFVSWTWVDQTLVHVTVIPFALY
jgi:hypothetical protein